METVKNRQTIEHRQRTDGEVYSPNKVDRLQCGGVVVGGGWVGSEKRDGLIRTNLNIIRL